VRWLFAQAPADPVGAAEAVGRGLETGGLAFVAGGLFLVSCFLFYLYRTQVKDTLAEREMRIKEQKDAGDRVDAIRKEQLTIGTSTNDSIRAIKEILERTQRGGPA
jgi:hypothetical protein